MKTKSSNPHRKRPSVLERRQAVKALPTENRNELERALRICLNDRSPYVRADALDVVREHVIRDLRERVLALLSDRNACVRYSAADCAGFLDAGEGLEAVWLYPLLHDNSMLVRIETIESLAQIGDTAALPYIAGCLKDGDELVRSYAAVAISDLNGYLFEGQIREALAVETEDRTRVGYAEALFCFGDESQFAVLLDLLRSDSYTTRCAAANTITWLDLTPMQLESALAAVAYAEKHALYRGDRTTMEFVLKALLEDVSSQSN